MTHFLLFFELKYENCFKINLQRAKYIFFNGKQLTILYKNILMTLKLLFLHSFRLIQCTFFLL